MLTKAKPGKSTHPYDTGVGVTTARVVEDNIQSRTSSQQTERVTTLRGQTTQTPDRLQKAERVKSTPSLLRDRVHALTSRRRKGLNFTPESQTRGDSPIQPRITFRSISRQNKNRGKTSKSNPSDTPSISPPQASTEPDAPIENRRRKWWNVRNQKSVCGHERDQDRTPSFIKTSSALNEDEEGDDLAALVKPKDTWTNFRSRCVVRYPRGKTTKNVSPNEIQKISRKPGRGTSQKQEVYQGTSKIANHAFPLQPDRESLKTAGPKLQMGHRKSISSSNPRPSTTGTSSTPGTATAHRDFALEDWRETPSPVTPTQALRLFLGTRRTPPPRTTTQLDPRGPKISVATCTPPLGRQSQESGKSRTSGRPSTEYKNRIWIPFGASPRPQLDTSLRSNGKKASGEGGEHLEPTAGEPVLSRSPNPKKRWDRILQKRWRSGQVVC
ncbi:hypothetical protein F4781DRAFT_391380 [Annulohypoxylon bovei var. microspora]|nr:hypothetical protein F4781DRAFT_391380 [Annulohypoxylon bovei var. microspora]